MSSLDSEFSDDDSDCSEVPFSPEDTILIFDWDDTVLPSTWIREQDPVSVITCCVSSIQEKWFESDSSPIGKN